MEWLLRYFYDWSFSNDYYRERYSEEVIIDHLVNTLNERVEREIDERGFNIQLSYSQRFNDEYRRYLRSLLVGFRERMRLFGERTPEPSENARVQNLRWQMERLMNTELHNMEESGRLIAYQFYSMLSGTRFLKRWVAKVGDPDTCATCLWMHGTTVGLNEPFLRPGQRIIGGRGQDTTYNYITRSISLAHPNCRCRTEFVRLHE